MKETEADLNGFPSKDIPSRLKPDLYRFLIVANSVTGIDEPLLHTMYVDKTLASVQAVQTLSRLNRAHPQKYDTFVMDFADNEEAVKAAFQDYYRATVQLGETDANKLHDLKAELDGPQVHAWAQVEQLVALSVRHPGPMKRTLRWSRADPLPRATVPRSSQPRRYAPTPTLSVLAASPTGHESLHSTTSQFGKKAPRSCGVTVQVRAIQSALQISPSPHEHSLFGLNLAHVIP